MNVGICTDKEYWNQAALNLGASIYHSWEWGDLRQAEGWRSWRVLTEENDQPVAVTHILEKRLPLRLGALLYAAHGIVSRENDDAAVVTTARWLKNFARERRAFLLRADPEFADTDDNKKKQLVENGFRSIPDQWSFWNSPRATMVVDLKPLEDDILHRMRSTHRQRIRNAIRDGIDIEVGTEPSHLQDFYNMVLKSSQRQGFVLRDSGHFELVRQIFLKAGKGLIFIARQNGRPAAAVLSLFFGSTCLYLHGGFDPEIKLTGATETLHWKAMQWAKQMGCTKYDFLGTGTKHPPMEGNRGYGLYSYKKGFGAELVYTAGYFELRRGKARYGLLRLAERNPKLVDLAVKIRSLR